MTNRKISNDESERPKKMQRHLEPRPANEPHGATPRTPNSQPANIPRGATPNIPHSVPAPAAQSQSTTQQFNNRETTARPANMPHGRIPSTPYSSVPAPAAQSQLRTQDFNNIVITAEIVAPEGEVEWFKEDRKIPASTAAATTSQDIAAFGTINSSHQGLGFQLDPSALRRVHETHRSIPLGFITAKATFRIGTYDMEVGSCKAVLIRRTSGRNAYWYSMVENGRRAFRLAFDLFDQHGYLLAEYFTNNYHRGSWEWGPELGYGHILLFEDVDVNHILRGRGFDKKLVDAVLEKVRTALADTPSCPSWAKFYAFAKPDESFGGADTVLDAPGTAPTRGNRIHPGAEQFWRSCGFTRVGSSSWLALAGGPSPKYTAIDWAPYKVDRQDVSKKAEAVYICFQIPFSFGGPEPRDPPRLDILMDLGRGGVPRPDTRWVLNRGLHVAPDTYTTPDLCAPSALRPLLLNTSPMSRFAAALNPLGQTPRQALRQNPVWRWKDTSGNNVLHIAALTERAEMTLDILCIFPELAKQRNNQGFTPLEALQRQHHLLRTWPYYNPLVGLVPGDFNGFNNAAVETLARLAEPIPDPYVDPVPGLSELQRARIKYGCTCGACQGGYLSARMRGFITEHANQFGEETPDAWLGDWYGNRDEPIVTELTFLRAAEVISEVLKDDGKIPDVATVQAEWAADGGEHYGDIAKHIRHVGAKIVQNAELRTVTPETGYGGLVARCRNDYEFQMVREALGFVQPAEPVVQGDDIEVEEE